jgi:hypothetical protein
MKQTAVEWLQEQIETKFDIIGDTNNVESMFIDAKEMEKQQQDEFAIGFYEWRSTTPIKNIDQYTNKETLEMYKKEKGL